MKSGQVTRKGDEGVRRSWYAAQYCYYEPDFFAEASARLQMRLHATEEKFRMSQCEGKSEFIVMKTHMLRRYRH